MKLNAALELPEADVGEQMLQRGLIVDIRHDVPTISQPTWTVFFHVIVVVAIQRF